MTMRHSHAARWHDPASTARAAGITILLAAVVAGGSALLSAVLPTSPSTVALASGTASAGAASAADDALATLGPLHAYAWTADPAFPGATAGDRADAEVARRIRSEVDLDLAARGLAEVPRDKAEVMLTMRLRVEPKHLAEPESDAREPDAAEGEGEGLADAAEESALTLQLTDPASGRLCWEATARHPLCTVSHRPEPFLTGVAASPRGHEWKVADMVAALMTSLPPIGAAAAPVATDLVAAR